MPIVDSVIAAVSPRWAASRARWRTALTEMRSYEAAQTGRRTDGWRAAGTSANAEIGPAAARLRARSRDLARNNPYASRAVRVLTANLIGTGITPRFETDDAVARAEARREWEAFSEQCDPEGLTDFYGIQALVTRTVVESGEALVRLLPRPSGWGLTVPLQLQVLEPDFLDSGKSESLRDGGAIVQGVEFDSFGRRVAYWLFQDHPGESILFGRRSRNSVRVEAREILHVFDRLRPGQARGVPWMAPVALRLRDVADYDEAELVRKKIEACFAAFVERSADVTSPLAKSTTTDTAGRRIERLSPGLIQYLGAGEKVTFGEPKGSAGYVEYMRTQLHAVAAGAGVTYEQLTGDLSQVNYSSLREGKVAFWQLLDAWQWQMLIPQLCRPVQARVALLGSRRHAGLRAVWTPPARPWVDPKKDIEGRVLALRAGLTTLREEISAQGFDPDEQLDEIAAINATLDALGLTLDGDPRKVSAAGLTQARPPGSTLPTTEGGEDA